MSKKIKKANLSVDLSTGIMLRLYHVDKQINLSA